MGSSGQRVVALDGVRGIAVLLVVVAHVSRAIAPYSGSAGVTIFFVLSGYLITSVLLRERKKFGTISFGGFYARRALRLYPVLLFILLITPILLLIARDSRLVDYPIRAFLSGVYLSDIAEAVGFPMQYFNHTWSLAVEEQFYLVWPIILVGIISIATRRRSAAIALVSVLIVLAVAWRVVATLVLDPTRVYYAPDTNVFILLLGCGLALVPARVFAKVPLWVAPVLLIVVAVVSAAIRVDSDVVRNWVVFGAALLSVPIVGIASRGGRFLSFRLFTFFGAISYGLYLWHDLLLRINWGGHEVSPHVRPILALLAVGIAYLSFRFFEKPLLARFRPRFERVHVDLPTPTT